MLQVSILMSYVLWIITKYCIMCSMRHFMGEFPIRKRARWMSESINIITWNIADENEVSTRRRRDSWKSFIIFIRVDSTSATRWRLYRIIRRVVYANQFGIAQQVIGTACQFFAMNYLRFCHYFRINLALLHVPPGSLSFSFNPFQNE